MKKTIQVLARMAMPALLMSTLVGCATGRTGGINTAIRHIDLIETIANKDNIYHLSDYEGVALLSLGKAGAVGFGALGASGSVYVRDAATKAFGPPSFLGYGGVSAGLAYGGLNVVDTLLLFRHREDAANFAKRAGAVNFSNEASFLAWGAKQMTIPGASSHSDGAGLALGALELEFLIGGPRNGLNRDVYNVDAHVDKILAGDVTVPQEMKTALAKLNVLMSR